MCFVFLRRPRVAPRGRPRAPGARRPGQDRAPVFSALIAPRPRAQDRSTERCFENDDHVVHRHFRRPVLTSVLEKVVSPIHFDVVFTVFSLHVYGMRGPLAPRGCVCQPLRETSRAKIKHGPRLAGVFVDFAGVTVVRTYGASLFGRMTTYIN